MGSALISARLGVEVWPLAGRAEERSTIAGWLVPAALGCRRCATLLVLAALGSFAGGAPPRDRASTETKLL